MMDIDDMTLFVEVVRAKGFTNASKKLNIPTSTISVRINRFEQQLGLHLLNRTTRKIELTELGKHYFERAQHIVEEVQHLHHQLGDMAHSPSGILRISLPVDFSYDILAPLLPEFKQRYPLIQLELEVTPRKADLVAENVDLAIRMGEQENSTMISRLIARLQGGIYASPGYLARYGEPQTLDEIAQHQCLKSSSTQEEWLCYQGSQAQRVSITGDFFTQSFGLKLRLAVEGLGITLLPTAVAQQAVKQGRLQHILPQWQSQTFPCYALTTTRLTPAKTKIFIDFLKEKLSG